MEKQKCFLLSLFLSVCICDGYKLLAVFPMPSKSHGILGDNMVKVLLAAGHEVTYITPFKDINHPKLHTVDVSSNNKLFDENTMNVKQIMDGELNFQDPDIMFFMMNQVGESTLANENVQNLMKDPNQKFDAVISEYMFTDLYSVFPAVFQCPLIWFSTIEPHSLILNLVDGPLNPAYNGDYLHTHPVPFSFKERVHQLWLMADGLIKSSFSYHDKEEEIYLRLVAPIIKAQGRPVPSFNDLRYNGSIVLGNTQVALGYAVALPQSYKHIGGYHIDDEVKPLHEDLKKIMDNAKHGVIYFSMGSNLKSKDLPMELKTGLLKMLAGLKQTVLWKFEEVFPEVPKNIHILQWAPQQSILAHPNLVLFITHAGLLSVTEAIHFGVPLISVPVFADQFLNANRGEQKGFAKKVDLSYNLDKDLKVALAEVLNNPKYSAKAKELSTALKDRPMTPKEALNFWVQHIVRTRGAPHLRSPALDIPLYQRMYLDLLAVVLLATILLTLALARVICMFSVKKAAKQKSH